VSQFLTQESLIKLQLCDIDRKSIKWCKSHVRNTAFTNAFDPPLSIEPETLDCVVAFSVLTHMGEISQLAWLEEFARILRVGGIAVISVHGESLAQRLRDVDKGEFDAGELVVQHPGAAGTNVCCSYHPKDYVERTWCEVGFEIAEFREHGAVGNPTQDLWILRRK